jgi:hypothetical protein
MAAMPSQPLKTRRTRGACAFAWWITAAVAALLPIVSAVGAPEAVTTPGSGDLTICRSWIVYASCNTYHKVSLPSRIAIGDAITVTYGSNPKDYTFHVTRILQQDNGCRILSDASDTKGEGERIDLAQCRPVEKPAGAAEETPRKSD